MVRWIDWWRNKWRNARTVGWGIGRREAWKDGWMLDGVIGRKTDGGIHRQLDGRLIDRGIGGCLDGGMGKEMVEGCMNSCVEG